MATLLKCIQCGGLVSSQASQCQHCTTRYPFGVKCIVCCQTLKRSEALKITKEYGGAENKVSVKFFHRSCHNQVSQIRTGRARTSCPVCKYSIEFDTSSFVTCRNCGHNFSTHLEDPSFANCCYCGFRLNTKLEVGVKEVRRQFLSGLLTETIYAHRICYTKERQEQEIKLQKKERIDQAKVNKKHTETIRQKQTSRNIETLALSISFGLAIGIIIGGLGGGISYFVFGFGSSWQNAALLGFGCVFVLTIFGVCIFSFID
jgi:hypothetical protein